MRDTINTTNFKSHSILPISGSYPTASSKPLPIWRSIAETIFEHTKDEMYVEKNGVYDKLIIAHSFKEDLENNKLSLNDDQIEDFNPILTTRGICYTFNSQTLSEIWRPSLVTTTFEDLFPSDNVEKYFGGAGRVQGKLYHRGVIRF